MAFSTISEFRRQQAMQEEAARQGLSGLAARMWGEDELEEEEGERCRTMTIL